MAGELKSYVEKFLLNPAASFNVDEEGNEETSAQIIDSVAAEEGVENYQFHSKLRAKNEALLLESDSRYQGKRITRKDLKEDISFDPSLTKYFAEDTDEEFCDSEEREEESHKNHSRLSDLDSDDEDEDEDEEQETSHKNNSRLSNLEVDVGFDDEEQGEEGYGSDEEEKDSSNIEKRKLIELKNQDNSENDDDMSLEDEELEAEEDGGLIYDCDFNKFAEEVEEASDDASSTDEDDEDDEEEQEANNVGSREAERNSGKTIKKFQSFDDEEELKKSQCVKKQIAVYDSLFELRIGMQKGLNSANQFPQFNTYKSFLKQKDPNYMKNLASAKSVTKKLLNTLLETQMMLLSQNPETRYLMNNDKKQPSIDSEEITSSEDEIEKTEAKVQQGTKRKLKLKEYGDMLNKRHAAMIPYRDETITRWHEKTKLLSSARRKDKFSGFEVSALQQLKNVINNKEPLIRRTQLTGVTRGTTYHILGTNDENIAEAEREQYDPEIFDDNDFYSRVLEEILKSKMSLSDDMSDVSRKWIEIQKLRKKAKRKVDTKATKGRKLKYEVISKLQQYLAPSYQPQMDDGAVNTLFASLFGKGTQIDRNGSL